MNSVKKNNGVIEIDLLALMKKLWDNILLIIVVAALFANIALMATMFIITPKYTASVQVYVNNSSFTFGNTSYSLSSGEISAAQDLVDTYIVILKSRETINEVIEKSGLDYTYKELSESLSASAIDSTSVFKISVTTASPMDSEKLANTIAEVLPVRISDIVDGSSVRIVEYAIVPSQRSSPSYSKNVLVGLMLGAVAAAGYVVLKEIMTSATDNIIHSADDLAARYSDVPLLATIPDMRKTEKKNGKYYSYYKYSKS